MSLFEWFFERDNPGPTGSVETYHHKLNWPRFWIIVAGTAALIALLFFIYYLPFNQLEAFVLRDACLATLFTLAYLVLSYYVYIKPHYDNMGYLGFIDNPFKYTDDVNRFMLFFQALLLPGKIIAIPIVNLFSLCFKRKN